MAAIVIDPTGRVLVEKEACPVESTATVPRIDFPALNVTVPLGVPEPGAFAVTVAVKVTDCPEFDGLSEDTTPVEVLSLLTVWVIGAEVVGVKLPSPV